MADRWMDERDRERRDGRRPERYGRTGADEGRTWDDGDEGMSYGRDRVFGERESGADYGAPRYGRFEGGYGQGRPAGRGRRDRPDEDTAWQQRDYGGVSPAMSQGEYDLERGARRRGYDLADGGRYYGDDGREAVYRQEYGQGGVAYGREPRGYDAERDGYRRGRLSTGGQPSGGTGGYDYERGYGDGGRRNLSRGRSDFERGAHDAGDFIRRAGERVASWFGAGDEEPRGHRGRGPRDYQRPDERISEDAHERLTDDHWLDASNISISVSAAEVTLSGTVETREAKHRAERIVEEVSGVKHVQNNLRVDRGAFLTSPSRGYGDSVLEAQQRDAATGDGAEPPASRTGRGSTLSS